MTSWLKFAVGVAAALSLSAPIACAATPAKLSGSIAGVVRNSAGVPQMGATVLLFNRYERLIQRSLTNERGLFGFEPLAPDIYSIRVSLASFVPAVKQKITVQPGMQSLLYVDLASVLSSIELVYAVPGQGALIADDWKWTLKASSSTRPILRALPQAGASGPTPTDKPASTNLFSDTYGVVNMSGGDAGSLAGTSSEADLGTAFALATSLLGRNQIQLSGNFGYSARTGLPVEGIHTSFSRDGFGPEVAATVQQVYLPVAGIAGQSMGAPALRSISVATRDSMAITDHLRFDYGLALDSISFVDHLNSTSRFARLRYSLGDKGTVEIAYSAGAPPVQFLTADSRTNPEGQGNAESLANDLAVLSVFPRLSLIDGRSAVQRSQDFEAGYETKINDTTVDLTGYRESVTNLAMTIAGPDDLFAPGNLLPDISSKSNVLNVGSYQRFGYAAAVRQALGDKVEIGVSAGRAGALTAPDDITAASADDLRANLRIVQRFWASARASATLPVTGTQISGSYQWTDPGALMPSHFSMTQTTYADTGINVRVRQPIPSFFGMPGRFVATAEVRNLLAQGYVRMADASQSVLMIQNPRALRGGLSFIF